MLSCFWPSNARKWLEMPEIAISETLPAAPAPPQASSDAQLIEIWLHGRPAHTQRAYAGDIARLCAAARKPLPSVTLADLQGFADSLDIDTLASASRYRILSAVKSLLAFGHRIFYVPFDIDRKSTRLNSSHLGISY